MAFADCEATGLLLYLDEYHYHGLLVSYSSCICIAEKALYVIFNAL